MWCTRNASWMSLDSRRSLDTKLRPMPPGTTSSGAGGTESRVKAWTISTAKTLVSSHIYVESPFEKNCRKGKLRFYWREQPAWNWSSRVWSAIPLRYCWIQSSSLAIPQHKCRQRMKPHFPKWHLQCIWIPNTRKYQKASKIALASRSHSLNNSLSRIVREPAKISHYSISIPFSFHQSDILTLTILTDIWSSRTYTYTWFLSDASPSSLWAITASSSLQIRISEHWSGAPTMLLTLTSGRKGDISFRKFMRIICNVQSMKSRWAKPWQVRDPWNAQLSVNKNNAYREKRNSATICQTTKLVPIFWITFAANTILDSTIN